MDRKRSGGPSILVMDDDEDLLLYSSSSSTSSDSEDDEDWLDAAYMGSYWVRDEAEEREREKCRARYERQREAHIKEREVRRDAKRKIREEKRQAREKAYTARLEFLKQVEVRYYRKDELAPTGEPTGRSLRMRTKGEKFIRRALSSQEHSNETSGEMVSSECGSASASTDSMEPVSETVMKRSQEGDEVKTLMKHSQDGSGESMFRMALSSLDMLKRNDGGDKAARKGHDDNAERKPSVSISAELAACEVLSARGESDRAARHEREGLKREFKRRWSLGVSSSLHNQTIGGPLSPHQSSSPRYKAATCDNPSSLLGSVSSKPPLSPTSIPTLSVSNMANTGAGGSAPSSPAAPWPTSPVSSNRYLNWMKEGGSLILNRGERTKREKRGSVIALHSSSPSANLSTSPTLSTDSLNSRELAQDTSVDDSAGNKKAEWLKRMREKAEGDRSFSLRSELRNRSSTISVLHATPSSSETSPSREVNKRRSLSVGTKSEKEAITLKVAQTEAQLAFQEFIMEVSNSSDGDDSTSPYASMSALVPHQSSDSSTSEERMTQSLYLQRSQALGSEKRIRELMLNRSRSLTDRNRGSLQAYFEAPETQVEPIASQTGNLPSTSKSKQVHLANELEVDDARREEESGMSRSRSKTAGSPMITRNRTVSKEAKSGSAIGAYATRRKNFYRRASSGFTQLIVHPEMNELVEAADAKLLLQQHHHQLQRRTQSSSERQRERRREEKAERERDGEERDEYERSSSDRYDRKEQEQKDRNRERDRERSRSEREREKDRHRENKERKKRNKERESERGHEREAGSEREKAHKERDRERDTNGSRAARDKDRKERRRSRHVYDTSTISSGSSANTPRPLLARSGGVAV